MNKISNIHKILLITFVLTLILLILFFITWNNLDYPIKYKNQLLQAKSLLNDKYSIEVFEYGVDYWLKKSNYEPVDKLKMPNKIYKNEFDNPHVYINKGDTVVDGGVSGNINVTVELIERTGQNGRLIGFEPNILLTDLIKNRLKKYKNFELYPVGLWSKKSRKKLLIDNADLSDSLQVRSSLKPNWFKYFLSPTDKQDGYIKVNVIRLDDFVLQNNQKKIDYIRLNIEGSELEALKGAENTLKIMKPKLCIVLEHHPTQLFSVILYLNSLNLGYKFWYAAFDIEKDLKRIVLYAKP